MASTPATLTIQVLRANNLAAKDIGGTSDPFFKIGLIGEDHAWVGKTYKSNTVKKDLNPVWFTNKQRYEIPTKDAVGVRISVYDYDRVGKDDFLGLVDIMLSDLLGSREYVSLKEERELDLQPKSPKDKISGTITILLEYVTDNFFKKKESENVVEREKLVNDVAHAQLLPLDELKRLAAQFQSANKSGGPAIKNAEDLASLLTNLGLWEQLRSANVFGMGESVATVATKFDPVLKGKVMQDEEFKKVTAEFLFRLFDSDHDNEITFKEFIIGLAMHTKSSAGDRASFLFDLFDANHDGSLSVEELLQMQNFIWRAWLAAIRGSMVYQFQKKGLHVPSDSVERIHAAISSFFVRLKLGERVVNAILVKADKDKNSVLSRDEFVEFLSDPDAQESYRSAVANLASKIQTDIGEEVRPVVLQLIKQGRIW